MTASTLDELARADAQVTERFATSLVANPRLDRKPGQFPGE